jgi:dephospho-CoA kinase
MFVALGAHLVQADEIAHRLMRPGAAVYQEVVAHFGEGILNADGSIERGRLAEMVFEAGPDSATLPSSPRVAELNRIVHPAVIAYQQSWMQEVGLRDPAAVAIVEAALIFEAGAESGFDRLIVVSCRPEQRIERWARRRNVDQATARREVNRRMAAQWAEEEKIKAADYCIDNSGTLESSARQVQVIHAELVQLARPGAPAAR